MIDVGSQQSPQLVYFGTETRVKDPSKWVVPMELLAATFFVLIALLFVGLGQEMGRRFAAIDDRRGGVHGGYPRQPDGHRGVRAAVVPVGAGVGMVRDRAGDRRHVCAAAVAGCTPWAPRPPSG